MDCLMYDCVVLTCLEGTKNIADMQLWMAATICLMLIFCVFTKEQLENVCLCLTEADLNTELSLVESCANFFVLLKKHAVKRLSECNYSVVSDHLRVFDADYVLGSCLLEDTPNEFWVARRYKDKFELALVLLYHPLQLFSTDELTATFIVLKHQEIPLATVLLVKLIAHLEIIEKTMPTKVKSKRFLSENLLDTVCGALSLWYVDLGLGCCDWLSYFKEFFIEVELGEVLEVVIALLDYKRAGEHEGEV